MKILFDLFPVILFFATYKIAGHGHPEATCLSADAHAALSVFQEPILLATAVAIAATFAQVGWLLARKKKVDNMLWLSLGIIVVFGGATLYFRNATFIQWKPTVLYWLFAVALFASARFLGKNLIKEALVAQQVALPEPVWGRMNLSWVGFFAFLGALNLVAIHMLSCSAWVDFKLWGTTGLTFVFIILQGFTINKHFIEEEK